MKVCEKEFLEVKRDLRNAPNLQAFKPGEATYIITDASKKGLGALLLQVRNGCEQLVACASRCLKGAELNYSVIEKEALAIFWAINKLKKFV